MNFFLLTHLLDETATSETTTTSSSSTWYTVIMLVVLVVVFYFFMIRPQKKKEREEADMRNSLKVGDEVTTIGGIVGKVVSVREETFVLETTKDKTHIRFLRQALRSIDVAAEDSSAPQAPQEEPASKKPSKKKKAEEPALDAPQEPAADDILSDVVDI